MKSHTQASIDGLTVPGLLLDTRGPETFRLEDILPDAMRAIREHLGMEVLFISQFSAGRRVFRYVTQEKDLIQPGDSDPLEASYCQRIVDGRLPELIHDATQLPAARELPVTTALPVGAHLGVPIRLRDGSVYGTLCCFSTIPNHTLTPRDLSVLRAFADFAAGQIERQIVSERAQSEKLRRIREMLDAKKFYVVYQPIYQVEQDRIAGFESLTRFTAEPARSPDVWFKEAADAGLGEELEMTVIEQALQALDHLPKSTYLSLNVAPENIVNGAVARTLANAPLERIVLEVTEHEAIADYSAFAARLEPLRRRGLRLAVDDAGAGYASFRHILQLAPDIIKLDISLTRGIDADRTRRALAASLISFARQTRSKIIAEGVETPSELRALRELNVSWVQGYLLGRPTPLDEAATLIRSSARQSSATNRSRTSRRASAARKRSRPSKTTGSISVSAHSRSRAH